MNEEYKIIRDPIHGNIKLQGIILDLLETPEIQRLYNIKQLGLANLVFPGAHHTRLEHSLGTFHMALKSSEQLGLKKNKKEIISIAALLHDIGHGPFSHTLESILRETYNVDHVDLTLKIINGEYDIFEKNEKKYIPNLTVPEVLEKNQVDKKLLSEIIRGDTKRWPFLSQLLKSSIDVDQLDYILRDAYYTGVSYGNIDTQRFLQILTIYNDKLAIKRKGVGVVENILMARTLMYSNVYFHKTVRIAELMLSKAIESIPSISPFDLFKLTDDELIHLYKNKGPYQFGILTRLKYRKLFKQAYSKSKRDLNEEEIQQVKKFENINYKREKEKELENMLKIPPGHIIIDVPYKELHLAEPRIDQTEIEVVDSQGVKKLDDFTPTAKAIRLRSIPDWMIMIITDEKYRDIVSKKAEKIIFN